MKKEIPYFLPTLTYIPNFKRQTSTSSNYPNFFLLIVLDIDIFMLTFIITFMDIKSI